MTVREYAKKIGFNVVGKLKRMPDVCIGLEPVKRCPLWMDEADNEYLGDYKDLDAFCIITADGGVI